ncbi:MAG TPA: double-strand break repair protein AddB [Pseudolabrys sp.]|nr:double-strand break repair protein AddB [Pseudolabrys sp.]
MPVDRARVFNIPASTPFLRTLFDELLAGRLICGFPQWRDPLELARATIYLPTRRACLFGRDVFLEAVEGNAAILPRLIPIGDIEEDEIFFADVAKGPAQVALDLPPAIDGLARTMPLAALVLNWAKVMASGIGGDMPLVGQNPVTAFALAQDLAKLMDDMTTRQVDWHRLDGLVPAEFDEYWNQTLDFLKFVRKHWPAVLTEKGCMEPAERRDKLIAAETARLAGTANPIIAAGSTGSTPATANLLATIARLPNGALVLPGLDTDLDEPSWQLIAEDGEMGHAHPQFAMAGLLRKIGIERADVKMLGKSNGRERLVSEALRPAAASEFWRERLSTYQFAAHADAAVKDVAVIEAANAEEEALAIAVALRETVEQPGTVAALVTPDIALGRRVAAALERWNVRVQDSRGLPLAEVPSGVFARLVAETALGGFAPVPLLAMLKHPAGKFDPASVAALERAVLRGPRPRHGSAGLEQALSAIRDEMARFRGGEASALHHSDPRLRLDRRQFEAAAGLLKQITLALAPLEKLPAGPHSTADLARRHAEVLDALGVVSDELFDTMDDLAENGTLVIDPADYPELFHAALTQRKLYRDQAGSRVYIFGLLESRLQWVDRVVLGGLVEGVWPPETRGDPWLSRPMRSELGLDLPERRIGLTAHDFAQAMGIPDVVLSRAAKLNGTPTVASRFVQRLAAVTGEARWKNTVERGARYITLARKLDETESKRIERPAPTPVLEARPRRLSVTEIEDLLRDPYTIYARHILRLAPLDEIDQTPGAADRGTVIHNAIGEFGKVYPADLPRDPAQRLLEIGEKHFRPLMAYPEARAFWWPRFRRIAEWFAGFEANRRARLSRLETEISGRISIPFGKDSFILNVRADRIECLSDGRYAILDYKTGEPPTSRQVLAGLSPQLTLEAAILRNGGFESIASGASVAELLYVRLRGGAQPGEEKRIDFKDGGTPDDHADRALTELTRLLEQFADPTKPYYSLLHPMWKNHYGTYDHLARVREWSLAGDGLEEGEHE